MLTVMNAQNNRKRQECDKPVDYVSAIKKRRNKAVLYGEEERGNYYGRVLVFELSYTAAQI